MIVMLGIEPGNWVFLFMKGKFKSLAQFEFDAFGFGLGFRDRECIHGCSTWFGFEGHRVDFERGATNAQCMKGWLEEFATESFGVWYAK
jgi:hypothetical protein